MFFTFYHIVFIHCTLFKVVFYFTFSKVTSCVLSISDCQCPVLPCRHDNCQFCCWMATFVLPAMSYLLITTLMSGHSGLACTALTTVYSPFFNRNIVLFFCLCCTSHCFDGYEQHHAPNKQSCVWSLRQLGSLQRRSWKPVTWLILTKMTSTGKSTRYQCSLGAPP